MSVALCSELFLGMFCPQCGAKQKGTFCGQCGAQTAEPKQRTRRAEQSQPTGQTEQKHETQSQQTGQAEQKQQTGRAKWLTRSVFGLVATLVLVDWFFDHMDSDLSPLSAKSFTSKSKSKFKPIRWEEEMVYGDLALKMVQVQNLSCTPGVQPLSWSPISTCAGLGCQLLGSLAPMLCYAVAEGRPLNAFHNAAGLPTWEFWAPSFCPSTQDPFECYFGSLLPNCSLVKGVPNIMTTQGWPVINKRPPCQHFNFMRLSAASFLFRKLPDRVLKRMVQARQEVFGPSGPPERMVSIHLRWGDKFAEFPRVTIAEYVASAQLTFDAIDILEAEERGPLYVYNGKRTVFLSTSDHSAVEAFKEGCAGRNWTVIIYQRAVVGAGVPIDVAKDTHGESGLNSIIALLLSLEARGHIMTSTSNWGHLYNDLRVGRLDSQCGNCTLVTDLQVYKTWWGARPREPIKTYSNFKIETTNGTSAVTIDPKPYLGHDP